MQEEQFPGNICSVTEDISIENSILKQDRQNLSENAVDICWGTRDHLVPQSHGDIDLPFTLQCYI